METIFARASGPGRAGVAVVRVSGPRALAAAQVLAGVGPERGMTVARITGVDGGLVDQAVVLVFPGPESFTGEDVVEFQVHGSPAVVARLGVELESRVGARAAEAGEFTRRALENGRLGLSEVEGLADLVEAETEAQRVQAVGTFSGALRALGETWRQELIAARSLLEAAIDFADEDVPEDVGEEVRSRIEALLAEFDRELAGYGVSERLREGFEVAVVGAPNLGKSTLINRIAGREIAITSELAGTTRDVLEVRVDLGGLPVTFVDTAGLREARDAIEAEGIARAEARRAAADVVVRLVETEADLANGGEIRRLAKQDGGGGISGLTGAGLETLLAEIRGRLEGRLTRKAVISRERHFRQVKRARGHVMTALEFVEQVETYDLAAEEMRIAGQEIGALVGVVDVEHLLDEVFAAFCIGK